MSLGKFYNKLEKNMISDLFIFFQDGQSYLIPEDKKDKMTVMNTSSTFRILNIFISQQSYIKEVLPNVYNLSIGENIDAFIRDLDNYKISLNQQQFNIINCRFSIKYFFGSIGKLNIFLKFIYNRLTPGGLFVGFMLDADKINGIFTEQPSLRSGPYSLEMSRDYESMSFFSTVLVNDEICFLINKQDLIKICYVVGLKYITYVNIETIYNDNFTNINLSSHEKKFGFLNTIYIFQRM